jgi:anthranilate synthase/aminodeoxychorismate synthase-like glutamine amidotransferase
MASRANNDKGKFMLLMIDNYDSFTYNLVHYFDMLSEQVSVFRNDTIDLLAIERMKPSGIVISPGPCTPNETGICIPALDTFKGRIPILGICLGHQTIAHYFGAKVIRASEPVHGKVYLIDHDGKGLFKDIPSPIQVTRYHSLIVDPLNLPDCLEVTATTEDGTIMGLRHKSLPIESVQFHPEAILTQFGLNMLNNFINMLGCTYANT